MTEDRLHRYRHFASQYGVNISQRTRTANHLDVDRIREDSQLARACRLSLHEFVRVYRDQTPSDPRPNKDLFELPLPVGSERIELTERWNDIVRDGVKPAWSPTKPQLQVTRPPNHKSIESNIHQVREQIAKGQHDGRYLVVEEDLLEHWSHIFIRPLGVVQKAGCPSAIRVINDYSFPKGASVNDFSDRTNFPVVSYNPPRDIARRIFELRSKFPNHPILMMLGDVSGAFRHIPVSARHVHMFAFRFGGFIVIDLSCGFGWCGSPAYYAVAGTLINSLYQQQRPQRSLAPLDSTCLVGNVWCDDHTCIELDTGVRCAAANLALRKAMATVLGPTAINEEKFTVWSTSLKALGLLWNTVTGTVSVPDEKIAKTRDRIVSLLDCTKCTAATVNKLLGSLRYVSTCFPAARAFYQNVQAFTAFFTHHNATRPVPQEVRDDLRWFLAVLSRQHKFNSIPVERLARLQPPSRHVMMDASDTGVCVLEPQLKQYIRVKFSQDVRESFAASKEKNSINVRELMSVALAAIHWGYAWAATERDQTHVCMWIDNTSAVAWVNRRSSRHPVARTYNRLISLSEFQHSFTCSATHIPGEKNIMADSGSRAWSADHPVYTVWTNLSTSWMQVQTRPMSNDLSKLWETLSEDMLSRIQPPGNTARTGDNGVHFAGGSDGHPGCQNPDDLPTENLVVLQHTAGNTDATERIVATRSEQSSSS